MINIYDNIFNLEKNLELYKFILLESKFSYGESDTVNTVPTGMTTELNHSLTTFFLNVVKEKYKDIEKLKLHRAYVNLFFPRDLPYFHIDGDVITCIFYITPEYEIDEGGETQFYIEDKVIGVRPKPSRLIIFDGNILHRATSYRNNPRLTVVLKFHCLVAQ